MYSYRTNNYTEYNSHKKIWFDDGRVFFGEIKNNRLSEGKLCEIEKDKTYSLYSVKYDLEKDKDNS